MAPTTRSAGPKKARREKAEELASRTSSISKGATKRSAKASKKHVETRKRNGKSLPTVDEIRAAIRPEGTSVGELMKHFDVQPEEHIDMTKLLASINLPNSNAATGSSKTGKESSDEATGLFKPGFRPAFDDLYEKSPAEIKFGRRNTLFPASPGNVSSLVGSFQYSSPRRSIFGGTPPASATFPLAGDVQTASPRRSIFGRMASVGAGSSKEPDAGNVQDPSPRKSEFGRMASVSGFSPARNKPFGGFSPRRSIFEKTPSIASSPRIPQAPRTPQSPFLSSQSQPAKITVSASTKQEAEGVVARQQLVRESLFELRGIITNLNWKVQQFEALVDKTEKDVIWDTASIVETDQEGGRSGKKLRFSIDPSV